LIRSASTLEKRVCGKKRRMHLFPNAQKGTYSLVLNEQ
jgi:hypothetical protein